MKRLTFLASFLFLLVFPFQVEGKETTDRVIVTFKEQIDHSIVEKYSLGTHHTFESFAAISMTIPTEKREELISEEDVIRVESDPVVKVNAQLSDWGYEKVNAKQAKKLGLTGKGVKIGIIDTGVSTNHPDLKVAGGVSVVEGQLSFHDDEGHGTHVAGIIAALDNTIGIVGIAPDAEIYAIKALDRLGEGNQSDIIAGIEWAIQNKMDVINLSLTAPEGSYLLNEVLEKAYKSGILLVAASGNSLQPIPDNTDVMFPARYPTVIAVGAVGHTNDKSSFSYFGNSLDFVAPGERVLSTFNGIIDGASQEYAYMNGTSMAAPFVTGVAALYKQAYPNLNNQGIREKMQQSAIDLGEKGKDTYYGYGLVQAPEISETATFSDIPSTIWYEREIDYLYKKEIITGYPDGKFYPNHPVTRAEAITMIGKALGMKGELRATSFLDVPNGYYASGYIRNAVEQQIITGFPDQTFKPKTSIIRGDVAVMLQKAFAYEPVLGIVFSDVKEDKYYYNAVHALKSENISTGYPDGTFKPGLDITRAEFSILLARALDESFK